MSKFSLNVADGTGLTDSDWEEINVLRSSYEAGGMAGLDNALAALADGNPIQYVRVMAAFFPDLARDTIRDVVANAGLTVEDIDQLIQRAEGRRNLH